MSEKRDGIDRVAGVEDSSWVGLEISGSEFADVRLTRRFQKLMEQLAKGIGKSIPLACQDWAGTKAAYRFLSNERVGLEQILAGHFQSTRQRVAVDGGPILVVHDTTEFIYNRTDPVSIGLIGKASTRKDEQGEPVLRTRADRKTGSGQYTIAQQIKQTPCRGTHQIKLPREKGEAAKVVLEVRYGSMQVLVPPSKRKRFSPLELTVIHAKEQQPPQGREPIEWTLITNLEVVALKQAVEKLNWYTQRWKIETFHKILKTGCKAEQAKFESAGPLNNFLAILCILSWRIFWLTMIQRSAPDTAPDIVFTPLEIRLLDQLKKDKPGTPPKRSLSTYLAKVARLGGYLARNSDPPPGNMVIWRGFSRLVDIQLGALLGAKLVGN